MSYTQPRPGRLLTLPTVWRCPALTRRLLLYASDGTLFFDEIAEMPLMLQATLLRLIEEMRIRPFGSQREVPLNRAHFARIYITGSTC